MEKNIIYEGFEELNEAGYKTDEVIFFNRGTDRVCKPVVSLVSAQAYWAGKNEKVLYTGKNGYSFHHDQIQSYGVQPGTELTVDICEIGAWCSYYVFKEIPFSYNTVMFERMNNVEG